MAEYRVPRGCTGLSMEDGTRYNAGRDGKIVVDRPDHARHIERVGHNGGGHIHKVVIGGHGAAGHECACGFMAYAWQRTCPKCGAPLKAETGALR